MSRDTWKKIAYSLIFCLLVLLGVQIITNVQSAKTIREVQVPIPSISDLQREYGEERNLTSGDVRSLYNKLISDISQKWENEVLEFNRHSMELDLPSDHTGSTDFDRQVIIPKKVERLIPINTIARGLNLLRHRIRLYCRTRDAEVSPIVLALRDVWVHGVAGMLDWTHPDNLVHRVGVEVPSCLMGNENMPCPSYDALKHGRNHDDESIIHSAHRTNEWYNQFAKKESEHE